MLILTKKCEHFCKYHNQEQILRQSEGGSRAKDIRRLGASVIWVPRDIGEGRFWARSLPSANRRGKRCKSGCFRNKRTRRRSSNIGICTRGNLFRVWGTFGPWTRPNNLHTPTLPGCSRLRGQRRRHTELPHRSRPIRTWNRHSKRIDPTKSPTGRCKIGHLWFRWPRTSSTLHTPDASDSSFWHPQKGCRLDLWAIGAKDVGSWTYKWGNFGTRKWFLALTIVYPTRPSSSDDGKRVHNSIEPMESVTKHPWSKSCTCHRHLVWGQRHSSIRVGMVNRWFRWQSRRKNDRKGGCLYTRTWSTLCTPCPCKHRWGPASRRCPEPHRNGKSESCWFRR